MDLDDDIRDIVEDTRRLVRENNEMLSSMKRRANFSLFVKFIYWIVIVGLAVGTYVYVQPYVEQLLSVYKNIQETNNKISSSIPNLDSVKDFLGISPKK